ncbi:MAG: CBS domain-containing protein [Brevirhabdus sp.]
MLVQQVLKLKSDDGVVTVSPASALSDAAAILSSRRIGSVVVSEDGKAADGMLSERDIVRELGKRGPRCMSDKVGDVMTANPVTCGLRDRADDVLQKMTDGRFRHLPVVENGEMVGIVTIGDVVKARLMELAMEKDALEGMIMGH